jgi:inorganic pyrophosphatase
VRRQAKIETQTRVPGNPLMQDVAVATDGGGGGAPSPRFYALAAGSPGNYGGIPQTWEDSTVVDKLLGEPGDNDPVDFVDVASAAAPVGAPYLARVLGCLGMVDKGADYKVLVANAADRGARAWRSVFDVPEVGQKFVYFLSVGRLRKKGGGFFCAHTQTLKKTTNRPTNKTGEAPARV